MLGRK